MCKSTGIQRITYNPETLYIYMLASFLRQDKDSCQGETHIADLFPKRLVFLRRVFFFWREREDLTDCANNCWDGENFLSFYTF